MIDCEDEDDGDAVDKAAGKRQDWEAILLINTNSLHQFVWLEFIAGTAVKGDAHMMVVAVNAARWVRNENVEAKAP